MTYEGSTINFDGVMNLDTGVFTAPADGVYYFAFNTHVVEGITYRLKLLHNDKSEAESSSSDSDKSNPMVYMDKLLNLTAGDKVSVVFELQIYMHEWFSPTRFSGFLVSA